MFNIDVIVYEILSSIRKCTFSLRICNHYSHTKIFSDRISQNEKLIKKILLY